MENTDPEEADNFNDLLETLQSRADRLLDELRLFQTAQHQNGKADRAEMRVFCRGIESEVKSLKTIAKRNLVLQASEERTSSDAPNDEKNSVHALKSSNLPFYEAVWRAAKSCGGVVALERYMSCQPPSICQITSHKPTKGRSSKSTAGGGSNEPNVLVDVIAENGLKWIKVSTITNKRLLFDIAKEGWETYGDFSSDEEFDNTAEVEAPKLGLVKLAESLHRASKAHRVRFKHPLVHMILPNIQEFAYDDIDAVLTDIRDLGVILHCSRSLDNEVSSDIPLDKQLLKRLTPGIFSLNLTQQLNIDCTILLAFISDISHVIRNDLPSSPQNRSGTYHTAILRQIDCEANTPLLPNELYEVVRGRILIAASMAVDRMYQIVNTMGTKNEKYRADIFFGREEFVGLSSSNLRERLQEFSCHDVPEDLQLPIRVVDFEEIPPDILGSSEISTTLSTLNINEENYLSVSKAFSPFERRCATRLRTQCNLSPINTSVFQYGWMRDIVTVTSNKVVATSINKAIDKILDEFERAIDGKDKQKTQRPLQTSTSQHPDTANTHSEENNVGETSDKQQTNDLDMKCNPSSSSTFSQQDLDAFVGPKMYICETARSLIGKEKTKPPRKED